MNRFLTALMASPLALFAATGCSAQPAQLQLTDGSVPYAQYGYWTFYQTSSEAFDNQLSCAAVARLPGSQHAIRVERVADGYIYGFNGFDRDSLGDNGEAEFSAWFDDGEAEAQRGMGRFVRDPALPDDDWLSLYRAADDHDSAFDGFLISDTVSFAVDTPGKARSTMTFPIGTGDIVERGLDRCYEMGMHYARETEGPIPACPGGETRLPLTGLCRSDAMAMLTIVEGPETELIGNCTWSINEAALAGQMLLYRAAECSGRVSRLYGGAGAHMAELELVETAFHEDGSIFGKLEEPVSYAHVFLRNKPTPAEDVAAVALDPRMPDIATGCVVRKMDEVTDGYTVDVSPAERARQPQDEPPAHLCGDYGYGDDADLWRVFQGYAWFLKLGQDSYQDVDYRSLTLLEPDGETGWKRVIG